MPGSPHMKPGIHQQEGLGLFSLGGKPNLAGAGHLQAFEHQAPIQNAPDLPARVERAGVSVPKSNAKSFTALKSNTL